MRGSPVLAQLFLSFFLLSTLSSRGLTQVPPPSPVEVEPVLEEMFVPTTLLLGTVEPKRRSVVAASIEGYVVDYPIEEGMRVRKGDVLAKLRDTVLRLQLKEAEAALEETREQHENAERDLKRARQLIEKDAVTQKELDRLSTRDRTVALQIPQAEAKVEILKTNIAKKKVTSPFDGQIVREHSEIGEWVPLGGPVATLVDISSVYIRVNVPERYVRFVDESGSVAVSIPAARGDPFRGKVVAVSDEGDAESRTFPVRVEVENEGQIRAGMSARVEFPAGLARKTLVVSKDALLLQGTRSYVFVVTEGGAAERRAVRTGASSGSKFAVLEGLRRGEKVVVRGNERVQPGMPVRILSGEGRNSTR